MIEKNLIAFALCYLVGLPLVSAEGWQHTTSQKRASQTAIRVEEPAGYTLVVGAHADTIPAIIALPNQSAFVWVTVSRNDTEIWKSKMEVSPYQETTIQLAKKAKTTRGPQQGFVGDFVNDLAACDKRLKGVSVRYRVYFDGEPLNEGFIVGPMRKREATVLAGDYHVRAEAGQKGRWISLANFDWIPTESGWRLTVCDRIK